MRKALCAIQLAARRYSTWLLRWMPHFSRTMTFRTLGVRSLAVNHPSNGSWTPWITIWVPLPATCTTRSCTPNSGLQSMTRSTLLNATFTATIRTWHPIRLARMVLSGPTITSSTIASSSASFSSHAEPWGKKKNISVPALFQFNIAIYNKLSAAWITWIWVVEENSWWTKSPLSCENHGIPTKWRQTTLQQDVVGLLMRSRRPYVPLMLP